MVELSQLWLPILLGAIAVFFASFVAWMVSPHHRKDWAKLPHEDEFLAGIKRNRVVEGQFMAPHCSGPAEMKDPHWIAKHKANPRVTLTVKPSSPGAMPKQMAQSFLLDVVVLAVAGYVASITILPGADAMLVFRVTGTVAIAGFSLGLACGPIWFGRTWSSTLREMLDGVVYGLIGAAFLAWLWPS